MNSNYPYPKNELEFYSRNYSVDQLIKNYDFPNLMAYYLYGMNTLKAINEVIDNKLYDLFEKSPNEVYEDKLLFVLRTTIIKNALRKMDVCDVLNTKNNMFVCHLN